jgi:hypothetical protein
MECGVLIIAQVATALVLFAGAGLLIHSFIKAIGVEPGFAPTSYKSSDCYPVCPSNEC